MNKYFVIFLVVILTCIGYLLIGSYLCESGSPESWESDINCYVFAYGSLVNDNSMSSTLFSLNLPDQNIETLEKIIPNSSLISDSIQLENSYIPCRVKGIKREWNFVNRNSSLNPISKSPLYLGADFNDDSYTCNGVLIPISGSQLDLLDQRESGYTKKEIEINRIFIIGTDSGKTLLPNKKVYFYANQTGNKPLNNENPIVQSYVDTVLNGFISIDNKLKNNDFEFSKEFISSTYGWDNRWINDRIYPYRPFIFVSNATVINKILKDVLGENIINKIETY